MSTIEYDKELGVQNFDLMSLVLQHYFEDQYFENLKQQYNEKDIYQAMYVCVKRKFFNGKIKAIKTIPGKVFIIGKAESISSIGELFINNHS